MIRDIRRPTEPSRTYQTELTRMLKWCRPVLQKLQGWEMADCKRFLQNGVVSEPMHNYIKTIEATIGCPVSIVSVGATHKDKIIFSSSHQFAITACSYRLQSQASVRL